MHSKVIMCRAAITDAKHVWVINYTHTQHTHTSASLPLHPISNAEIPNLVSPG